MPAPGQTQDVEDADLGTEGGAEIGVEQEEIEPLRGDPDKAGRSIGGDAHIVAIGHQDVPKAFPSVEALLEIGRASCRERV